MKNLDIIAGRNYIFFSYLDASSWINNKQFVKTGKYLTKIKKKSKKIEH